MRLASLLQQSGHRNIVKILNHGRSKFNFYFIDMELCDLTLSDYIDYGRGNKPCPIDSDVIQTLRPVFVPKDSPSVNNLWTIGIHIVSGLEFMHSHKYAHRDLKPSNGVRICFLKLIIVLYSLQENLWKLTDFGLSVEATSKIALTTQTSKGTPSYRAPELLKGHVTFNNKVDIWALGCVLYELATHQTMFPHDMATMEYSANLASIYEIRLHSLPTFWEQHVAELIRELIHRDPQQRPRASEVCQIFAFYNDLSSHSLEPELIANPVYRSVSEWRTLVGKSAKERDFRLADLYEEKGDQSTAHALRQHLILTLRNEAALKFHSDGKER